MAGHPYRVKVEKGLEKGLKFTVKSEALVIGSEKTEADILIEGPGVAPRHAQIVFQGGQVKLEDLGSPEGTFRNGQRLLGPVQVFPGDRIGLGPEVVLILEGDDPAAAESTEDQAELGQEGEAAASSDLGLVSVIRPKPE